MSVVQIKDQGGDTLESLRVEENYIIPKFFTSVENLQKAWENMPNFKCREDDVMLWTYPKSGTNWMFEVITMLFRRKAERVESLKITTNLEGQAPEVIDAVSSPRVLNTHIHYRFLPREMAEKKVKTILCMRNPKDTAVSYYNHMLNIKIYNYSGKWENWLPSYVNGDFEYGTYESFLQECAQAVEEALFPIHVMYYEDLKGNGVEEIKRLAKFLDIEVDEQLSKDIEDMCTFKKMKDKFPKEFKEMTLKGNTEFFRKGEVADWKNWFTVAQNEMFDKVWNERMKTSPFTFKYELCDC